MGREVKRVSMDFDWPLSVPWKGYVNPHHTECENCEGSGSTSDRQRLSDLVHLLMISGNGIIHRMEGRKDVAHPWLCEPNFCLQSAGEVCGEDMRKLATGLAGNEPVGRIGFDSLDRYRAENAIIKAAGLDPETWGVCPKCDGKGISKESMTAYETWTPEEPPKGEGWQVWETVSDGSPISPVFATAEELAEYMSHTRYGADRGTPYETWLDFIKGSGWAPSLVISEGVLMTGVQYAANSEKGD